jgi:hypothetical protein
MKLNFDKSIHDTDERLLLMFFEVLILERAQTLHRECSSPFSVFAGGQAGPHIKASPIDCLEGENKKQSRHGKGARRFLIIEGRCLSRSEIQSLDGGTYRQSSAQVSHARFY